MSNMWKCCKSDTIRLWNAPKLLQRVEDDVLEIVLGWRRGLAMEGSPALADGRDAI